MPRSTNFEQVKILVIEDNNDHWILIEKVIRICFAKALTIRVTSAEKALELFEGYLLEEWEMPKLILLDLYLPTLDDSLKLLKQVKEMPLCKVVPIVALSASDQQSDICTAYDYGVSSYCLKPSSFNEWVALFEHLRTYWLETATLPPTRLSVF